MLILAETMYKITILTFLCAMVFSVTVLIGARMIAKAIRDKSKE